MTQNITVAELKAHYDPFVKNWPEDAILGAVIDQVRDKFDYLTNEKANIYDLTAFQTARWKKAMIYAVMYRLIFDKIAGLEGEFPDSGDIGVTTVKLGDLTISKKIVDKYTMWITNEDKCIQEIGVEADHELTRSGLLCRRL